MHHYEVMGGRSPYNDHTMRQADALRARLRRDGIDIPVVVGMRNWDPYIIDAMRELAEHRAEKILGFILAAHRCEASWERYQSAVEDARSKLGPDALQVEYPEPWHTHPKFIEAVSGPRHEALAKLDRSDAKRAELIFTAHSVPVPMANASGYVEQIRESAAAVHLAARARIVARSRSRAAAARRAIRGWSPTSPRSFASSRTAPQS